MSHTRSLLKRLCLTLAAGLLALDAGAQSFAQPKVIPTGNWPAAIYTADFNGDGFPDLAYIDQGATLVTANPAHSTTHVLLNDGHGTFTPSATIPTTGNCLAIADLDGDGHPDLIWLSASSIATASLYTTNYALGKGDGTFAAAKFFGSVLVPAQPTSLGYLVAGHFSKPNGILDLAFENTANPTLYVMQAGTIPISNGTSNRPLAAGAGPITLADLNHDGLQDLIIQEGQTATIFLGQVETPFYSISDAPTFAGPSNVHSLLIQDVNFDGLPDLIAEGANGHIDVFPGNGDGTFQTASAGGTGPLDGLTGNGGHLIAIADLNHDGLPDALTATPAGISSLLGQGTAYLGLKGIYNAGPGRASYALADFNADGNLDLAIDSPEGIAILFGNPDGTFQTSQAFAAGQPALSGALAAFSSSGHLDSVVSTSARQAQLLRGQGDGTFIAAPAPTSSQTGPPGLWSVVLAGDLDSDGNLDLLLTADGPPASLPKTPNGAQVQLGDGTGNFAPPLPLITPYGPGCSQSPGYFYGTSTLGANLLGTIIINRAYDGAHYILNGNHHFPTVGEFYNSSVNGAQPCGPFAHDLAVTGVFTPRIPSLQVVTDTFVQADGHLYFFPTYTSLGIFNTPAGDLAVDGSLTSPGQLTAPQLSSIFNGPAISTSSGGLGFPAFPGAAAVADLDRDGNADLIVTYANLSANLPNPISSAPNYIYIWFGDGTGHFPTSPKHPVNPVRLTPSRNFYQVAVADLNLDGIPDLILSDGYLLSIQYGKGDGTFGTETHYLAGQGINSISIGDVNRDGKPDLILANGGVALSNPVANLDTLATNPGVSTGGITVLLNHATAPPPAPTGTVTANPEPSTYASLFTITATLPFPAGGPNPSGTVTFSIDGNPVGTTSVIGLSPAGIVYAAPNTLAVGTHVLTAIYSGDSNYSPATLTGSHTVAQLALPITLTASPEPSIFGSSFLITATLAAIGNDPGTFSFSVDGVPLGSVSSTTNTASIAGPSTLAVGVHTLTVAWLRQASALAIQATATHTVTINTTSLTLRLCVDAPGSNFPCGTPLGNTPLVSPVSMYFGQTLDGIASESSVSLTGTINFLANNVSFCIISASIAGGGNTCPPTAGNFQAGTYTVDAVYSGDANNAPSTSNSIAVSVFPDPTTAAVTSSSNPAVVGTPVTFTALLQGNFATPTGTVVFADGPNIIGTGTLDSTGHATFTTAALTVGTHPINVVYAGNSNFNPVTSPALAQVIIAAATPPPTGPASFTLTVSPTPLTLGAGRTGILLVSVTANNGFAQPVQLSCAGLPNETSCTFVNAIIPSGGGSTTLQFATSAPHDCGDPSHPYFLGENSSPHTRGTMGVGLLLLATGLFRPRRRLGDRKKTTLLLLALTLAGLSALSGCGHCTDLGTRPGTYTFTVTATAQGGPVSETQAQTIPLTVTIP